MRTISESEKIKRRKRQETFRLIHATELREKAKARSLKAKNNHMVERTFGADLLSCLQALPDSHGAPGTISTAALADLALDLKSFAQDYAAKKQIYLYAFFFAI